MNMIGLGGKKSIATLLDREVPRGAELSLSAEAPRYMRDHASSIIPCY
jgi:hypothetical protein